MTDFLKQLAAKSLGAEEALRPRLPSLFEPVTASHGLLSDQRFELPQADKSSLSDAMDPDALVAADDALRPLIRRSPETEPLSTPDLGQHSDMPHSSSKNMADVFDPNLKDWEQLRQVPTDKNSDAGFRGVRKVHRAHQPDMQSVWPSAFGHPAFANERTNLTISQNPGERPHQRPAGRAVKSIPGVQADPKPNQSPYAIGSESEIAHHRNTAVTLGQRHPESTIRRLAVQHAATPPMPGPLLNAQTDPASVRTKQPLIAATDMAKPHVRRSVETQFGASDTPPRGISDPKLVSVIQVTIGRIEVRATLPAASPRKAEPGPKRKTMTLEEYLKQRSGDR
jgi:hypothetical protein